MENESHKAEEEKVPFEIALHNLRYDAADAAETVLKAKKKALLVLIASAVVLLCAGVSPVLYLFHNGRPLACALLVLLLVILAAAAYFVSGQIFLKRKASFLKLAFLHNGWRSAVEDMDEVEELQLSKKVYDKDIEKTENRLISACEKLLNEYNKNSKE